MDQRGSRRPHCSSKKKRNAIIEFHGQFLENIERTPYGLNTCGAEPLRQAFFDHYCKRLYTKHSDQMRELAWRVRWCFFASGNEGLSYAPAYYQSREAANIDDRMLSEFEDSDLILAFTGRTGTLQQVRWLLRLHNDPESPIDLEKKPLVLLGWFGGTVHEYLLQNSARLGWLLDRYRDLEPESEIPDWHLREKPAELAARLVRALPALLGDSEP